MSPSTRKTIGTVAGCVQIFVLGFLVGHVDGKHEGRAVIDKSGAIADRAIGQLETCVATAKTLVKQRDEAQVNTDQAIDAALKYKSLVERGLTAGERALAQRDACWAARREDAIRDRGAR